MSEEIQAEQLITEITVRYGQWKVVIKRSSLESDQWYWHKHGIGDALYFGNSDAAVHAALVFLKAEYHAASLRGNANEIESEASQAILRISSSSLDDEKSG